jgi:hypothetical protein
MSEPGVPSRTWQDSFQFLGKAFEEIVKTVVMQQL